MAVVTLLELPDRVAGIVKVLGPGAFTPLWPIVAQMAASDVRNNIAQGHSPDGTPFIPLAHGRPGQPAGALPLRDTGILLASISGQPDGNGAVVGTNLHYAALHQFGGVVRPKRGKYLAIPLTKEAKRAGSPRNYSGPLSPRISRKTGKGVLVDDATDVAQYALVKEVRVPARPYLGFSPVFLDRVGRLVTDRVAELVGKAMVNGGR